MKISPHAVLVHFLTPYSLVIPLQCVCPLLPKKTAHQRPPNCPSAWPSLNSSVAFVTTHHFLIEILRLPIQILLLLLASCWPFFSDFFASSSFLFHPDLTGLSRKGSLRQGSKCYYFRWVVQVQGEWLKNESLMNHEDKKAVCSIDAFTWQVGLVRGGDGGRNTLRIVHRREEQRGFICLVSHTCFIGQSSRSIDSLELAGDIIQTFQAPI